jgi:TetR/AcrR family transcriptional regulator, cholesterol catabolism regulator
MTPVKFEVSRTQRRRLETRQRIVDAALQLFASVGYEETSMDAIAEAADVARTTVFNHFSRKESLLLKVLSERRAIIGEHFRETAGSDVSVQQQFCGAVNAWAKSYAHNPATGAALIRSWVRAGGPYLPDATATADLFAEALRRGQQRREIHEQLDTRAAGLILFDSLLGILVRWAGPSRPVKQSILVADMLRAACMVLEGFATERLDAEIDRKH